MMNKSPLSNLDAHLFHEGTHRKLYEKFGAHPATENGKSGVRFTLWAPNASKVSLIGDFNDWRADTHPMEVESEIWTLFVPGLEPGALYKYRIESSEGTQTEKSDPFAFFTEVPPKTASVFQTLDYEWSDEQWMANRKEKNSVHAPLSVYEMHMGSFRKPRPYESMSYREMAPVLVEYLKNMGFTHVELMPVMEHPYFGSWGYQITGYYACDNRYGSPQDLMWLIDHLHQNDIGVILDWVPSHFSTDGHGLTYFDGSHLYEYADPRKGYHPDWGSYIFDYSRKEVVSFLVSNALFWLDKYHADGLRVDAVASMLHLDYSRKDGEWLPNKFGGRENLEAIAFLRELNDAVHEHQPGAITIAEDSTAWPMVSRPTHLGGLGFDFKWDMGWMHDTLDYMKMDPIFRKFHHQKLTFRMMYAFSENFTLPLSHDEVVHGKSSLVGKMPGDEWQRFANLRLLFAYMYAQPGKKLLFMGGEFGQTREWDHNGELSWDLLQYPIHNGLQRFVCDLNRLYRSELPMHELDNFQEGFEWVDCHDYEKSCISLVRKAKSSKEVVLAVFNFTPVTRHDYRVGAPAGGRWLELLNSDAGDYGGSGQGNLGGVDAKEEELHNRPYSLSLTLPPLGAVFLKNSGKIVPTPKKKEAKKAAQKAAKKPVKKAAAKPKAKKTVAAPA